MAAKSVQVQCVAADGYMHIDAGSVASLELLRPLHEAPASRAAARCSGSLFGCSPMRMLYPRSCTSALQVCGGWCELRTIRSEPPVAVTGC